MVLLRNHMTRTRAALIHIAISAVFALGAAMLITFGWFPLPYFWLIGGQLLLALIIGVDIMLGPLMTFIVLAPSKSRKELFVDLASIALIQVAALGYGLHTSYASRLVYAVYVEGGFHLIRATELGVAGVGEGQRPEFSSLPLFGPRFIGAKLPTTSKGISDLSFYRTTGVGDFRVPEYYVPLAEVRQQMLNERLRPEILAENNPVLFQNVDTLLKKSSLKWTQVGVFPLDVLQRGTYTVLVNLDKLTVMSVFPQAPFM